MALILASSSQRRYELLRQLGLPFVVRVPATDEIPRRGEEAVAYALRNAKEKAQTILQDVGLDTVVIAADTIVVLENEILEKPTDETDAKRMLRNLAGKTHQVITGLCVAKGNKLVLDPVSTAVTFKGLSEVEISRYVQRGESMDKAGAYGAQGSGAYFIRKIEGSYTNVVGLPMAELCDHLKNFGIAL